MVKTEEESIAKFSDFIYVSTQFLLGLCTIAMPTYAKEEKTNIR